MLLNTPLISSSLASWTPTNNGSSIPYRWIEIQCNKAGSIVEINLVDSGLDGTLNRINFSAFLDLSSLSLSYNNLVGEIPVGIGNARTLTLLDLASNNFTYQITPEIGNLSELQVLLLYNNSFTGPIPHQVGNLQNVWNLSLGANYLEDPDPVRFKGMASLTGLWLYYNNLLEVPSFVLEFPKLVFLDLSVNLITVQVPVQLLAGLRNLEYLNLTENSFEGLIPSDIKNLSKLRHLSLGKNKLNGTIPEEIGLLSNLELLELQENLFQGPIPSSIGNLQMLQTLKINSAGLNSSVPHELGSCVKLDG